MSNLPAAGQMTLYSVVRFSAPGFHAWPNAPAHRDYLAQRHRHLFAVEVRLQVYDHDREVEFHDLLDFCRAAFVGGELGAQSCEMMAAALAQKITAQFPGRLVEVSVFEDGENGGLATYSPGL